MNTHDTTVTAVRDRIRGAQGVNMDLFILIILAADLFVVAGIVIASGTPQTLWVAPLVAAAPLVVFWIITRIMWKPWERRFPAIPQHTDAIVKRGQSISLGRFGNMNNCVAIAADAHALHLIPFSAMRIVGAKVVSIPWDRFTEIAEPPKFRFLLTKAVVDARWRLTAPEWAMSIGRIEDTPPSHSPERLTPTA